MAGGHQDHRQAEAGRDLARAPVPGGEVHAAGAARARGPPLRGHRHAVAPLPGAGAGRRRRHVRPDHAARARPERAPGQGKRISSVVLVFSCLSEQFCQV